LRPGECLGGVGNTAAHLHRRFAHPEYIAADCPRARANGKNEPVVSRAAQRRNVATCHLTSLYMLHCAAVLQLCCSCVAAVLQLCCGCVVACCNVLQCVVVCSSQSYLAQQNSSTFLVVQCCSCVAAVLQCCSCIAAALQCAAAEGKTSRPRDSMDTSWHTWE